ncbi:MAG TPA: hypothetical protein PLB50_03070 [Candidatus Saccharicenans sp.]|jgi:hypothetical protein|nr:hypothetical protein [Candidatus Saccharicenans sp.]HQO75645.1 hypothetical protein [Candidatus Saccharicenans sp.]HUM78747.1 hypothetical protein [Candidatus Saccharicenans sp.]
MKKIDLASKIIFFVLVFCLLLNLPLQPQIRKYQVIVPKVNLHLEPNENSPVVISVPVGEILAQASAVRFKRDWIFVYYQFPEKGKTLAGYVKEPMLRKLFPEVNSVLISSGEADYQPKELDVNQGYQPVIIWGASQDKLIETEGRPLAQEKSGETEVYQYRRQIMNKQVLIEYIFWRHELISARFHLLDNYTDNNYYISDYLKLKNYLETRLGQPVNDRVVWFDSTYQTKNEYWGKALGAGQLEFRSSWDIGDTKLDLILTGSDNRVAFVAECLGKKYKSSFSN